MNGKITTIVIGLVFISGLALLFVGLLPKQPEVQRIVNAPLQVEPPDYNFGTIDIKGGDVQTDFLVINVGTEPVIVSQGTTSCACTSASFDGVDFGMHTKMEQSVTIEPGERKTLTVTYDPFFHGPNGTGKVTREVILKTNSVSTPEVRVRIKADVINS